MSHRQLQVGPLLRQIVRERESHLLRPHSLQELRAAPAPARQHR